MNYTVGIVIYEGFSLYDVAGPFEVLSNAVDPANSDQPLFAQFSVGRNKDLVSCHGGIQILPQHIYPDAHIYDALIVPGGPGYEQATRNLRLMNWLERAARLAKVIAAVGTGSFVLAAARLLEGRKIARISGIGEAYPGIEVTPVDGLVADGRIITVSNSDYGSELGTAIIAALTA